jgi:uncharacterized protein YndB with AHSA1/START domain
MEMKMPEQLKLSIILPAAPETVFHAWLDSALHAEFTGSPAEVDARVGGAFSAWDGYITGEILELIPPKRIVQAWRTEFPQDAPASRLEAIFEPEGSGTCLTLVHTNIPEGQAENYRQGWDDFYFSPLQTYFSSGR